MESDASELGLVSTDVQHLGTGYKSKKAPVQTAPKLEIGFGSAPEIGINCLFGFGRPWLWQPLSMAYRVRANIALMSTHPIFLT